MEENMQPSHGPSRPVEVIDDEWTKLNWRFSNSLQVLITTIFFILSRTLAKVIKNRFRETFNTLYILFSTTSGVESGIFHTIWHIARSVLYFSFFPCSYFCKNNLSFYPNFFNFLRFSMFLNLTDICESYTNRYF